MNVTEYLAKLRWRAEQFGAEFQRVNEQIKRFNACLEDIAYHQAIYPPGQQPFYQFQAELARRSLH